MNVVFNSAYDDWLATQSDQNSAEVMVHFVSEYFVAEKRAAVFG
jgi:hypothetical protein